MLIGQYNVWNRDTEKALAAIKMFFKSREEFELDNIAKVNAEALRP
jgi:hypothetical protein